MDMSTYDFSGRVVMVTGANGNLGSAVARAFAARKAKLVLVGRSQDRVKDALSDLVTEATVWVAPSTDLTDPQSTEEMVNRALDRFGRIDVLANTVGGYEAGKPVHESPVEEWDRMMALNARSAFIASRAVIPTMLQQAHGRIIHTASRAALSGGRRAAAYAVSKAALVRLTEVLAEELKHEGITANCVLPGTIDTPENRRAMPNADHDRWVSPAAIARVFLYLASDDAQLISGAGIPVYGRS